VSVIRQYPLPHVTKMLSIDDGTPRDRKNLNIPALTGR
jgi:hypothetical protein